MVSTTVTVPTPWRCTTWRFVGVANVDILAEDAPDRISYWIEQRGMHGVRLWGGGPVAGHRFRVTSAAWRTSWTIRSWFPRGIASATWASPPTPRQRCRGTAQYASLARTLSRDSVHPEQPGPRPGRIQGPDSEAARDLLSLADFPRTYVNFSVNFVKQTSEAPPHRELLLSHSSTASALVA